MICRVKQLSARAGQQVAVPPRRSSLRSTRASFTALPSNRAILHAELYQLLHRHWQGCDGTNLSEHAVSKTYAPDIALCSSGNEGYKRAAAQASAIRTASASQALIVA